MQERRLEAIMFTDIVGFTALMQQDEDLGIKTRNRHREVFNEITRKYKGKILQYYGDGTLSIFDSAVDAVECGIEMQVEFQKEPYVSVRIGIHTGDVVFSKGEIIGDGVNIASRIESIAVPGSVFISEKVNDEIKNHPELKTLSIGYFKLKNVEKPIKIFAMVNPELKTPGKKQFRRKLKILNQVKASPTQARYQKNFLRTFSFMAGILLFGSYIYFYGLKKEQRLSENIISGSVSEVLLERSLAVLPFANLSNDPAQEYFIDGMVDEIIGHLFKVSDLRVISRTSSMKYKNTNLTLKQIGNELGVFAILEGSVRKSGNNVRITVQLIDANTDIHLWSETYDGNLSDVFSIQSEVAKNVARGLKATLTSKENDLIKNQPITTSQLAYDFYLKGNDYWSSKIDAPMALEMYSKAINEDSLFTQAYAKRAFIHLLYYWLKIEGWKGHDRLALEDIRKGFELDPRSIDVKFAQSVSYYMVNRNYRKSLKVIEELKEDAPNMADLYAFSSYNLRRMGNWEQSIRELKKAIQLDPLNASYIDNICGTFNALHQYDSVITYAKKGISLIPDYENLNRKIFRAYMSKKGDYQAALRESGLKIEDIQYEIYYYTRQFTQLIDIINRDITVISEQSSYRPKTYELALAYYLNKDSSTAKIYADSAITFLKEKIRETPNDDRICATLGKAYALTGNKKMAIAFGQRSVLQLPVSKDAYQGPVREQDLMEIFLLTANSEKALDRITYLLSTPSRLSTGDLISDPLYDHLRDLPRFKEIVDSVFQ